jgi:hypothetical protein
MSTPLISSDGGRESAGAACALSSLISSSCASTGTTRSISSSMRFLFLWCTGSRDGSSIASLC